MVSSTRILTDEMREQLQQLCKTPIQVLGATTPLPIRNAYKTPQTLGPDRLAAAVAGWGLANAAAASEQNKTSAVVLENDCGRFSKPLQSFSETAGHKTDHADGHGALVIDVGTAVTYDVVTPDGVYIGGNISPGVYLRLKSLNDYTDKLPLVDVSRDDIQAHLDADGFGDTTETAIAHGVMDGLLHEINGFISKMVLKYPNFCVFLTGGGAKYFVKRLKNCNFASDLIVLQGLDLLLTYQKSIEHEQK